MAQNSRIPTPDTVPQIDLRRRARALYWQGWGIEQIAEYLGVKRGTVSSWKRRDKWDKAESREKVDPIVLAVGLHCADGQWRQIVTVEDAVAGGCNLFDLDQLPLEYGPDEYANLLMCEFVDDAQSVFPLSMLMPCMIDSIDAWSDFRRYTMRPFGNRPVWIGYDPSHTGDSAGCVVVAPPAVSGGKFRVLEKHQWRGMDFAEQAGNIQKLTEKYNVTYIGIDVTGVGQGVYQLVKQFFTGAKAFNYSVDLKVQLVLKAYDTIRRGRLEFDAGDRDIAQAFMAIKKTTTQSGRQVTYQASRSEEVSHADLAWAVMHALHHEPLEGETARNRNIVEIC